MRYLKYILLLFPFFMLTSCNDKLSTSNISCDENLACPNDYYCANQDLKICCPENMYYDLSNKRCANICYKNPCGEDQICKSFHSSYYCDCEDGFIVVGKDCVKDLKCTKEDVFCNDATEYCYNGVCFSNNECSISNPQGSCPKKPQIEENYECFNGVCVLPSNGSKKIYESCKIGQSDCENGLFCGFKMPFSNYDELIGEDALCLPYCDLKYGDCPDDGECFPLNFNNSKYQNIGLCYYGNCKSDSGCDVSYDCKWLSSNMQFCDEVGSVLIGEKCNKLQKCDNDLMCIDGECTKFCDFEGKQPCPNSYSCLAWGYIAEGRTISKSGICIESCNPGICNDESSYNEYCKCSDNQSSFCNISKVDDCLCLLINGEGDGSCIFKDECNHQDNKCLDNNHCTLSPYGNYVCQQTGNKEIHEICSLSAKISSCKDNLYCFKFEEDVSSKCQKFCYTSEECPNGTQCYKDENNFIGYCGLLQ